MFAVAELMTFEVHESLIQFLFDAYYKEPSEGYQRVTLAQLALCDREVHLRLSDQCRSGFTLGSDGGLPLDRHLPVVLQMRVSSSCFFLELGVLLAPHPATPLSLRLTLKSARRLQTLLSLRHRSLLLLEPMCVPRSARLTCLLL